jgi:hypothetical protein
MKDEIFGLVKIKCHLVSCDQFASLFNPMLTLVRRQEPVGQNQSPDLPCRQHIRLRVDQLHAW